MKNCMEDPVKTFEDVVDIAEDPEKQADSTELDHYQEKPQQSQADWDSELTGMRNQYSSDQAFAGTNDEVEEEDGLDEDRVEIDISGDDVKIEDHDDADSREFMINPEDEPEWEEGEWNEIEDIAQEPQGESEDKKKKREADFIDDDGNMYDFEIRGESYASEYVDPKYEFNCSICGFNGIEENNNDLLENHYRDAHNITWDNDPQQMGNAMKFELERINPDDTEEQMIQDWDDPTW